MPRIYFCSSYYLVIDQLTSVPMEVLKKWFVVAVTDRSKCIIHCWWHFLEVKLDHQLLMHRSRLARWNLSSLFLIALIGQLSDITLAVSQHQNCISSWTQWLYCFIVGLGNNWNTWLKELGDQQKFSSVFRCPIFYGNRCMPWADGLVMTIAAQQMNESSSNSRSLSSR